MAAFGAGDQVGPGGASGKTYGLPNFVGELFTLSPLDTPFLSTIGGLTGGRGIDSVEFSWQDHVHRAPAVQAIPEGFDTTFTTQKRNVRKNVTMIHQYGVEITYTKSAAVGLLGSGGSSPTVPPGVSILGTQPVQNEMAFQTQVKVEQAALDVELAFLTGTYSYPNNGTARQTQGIMGWVSAATTTNWATPINTKASAAVINDIAKKLFIEGAPQRNMVIFLGATAKVELGESYSVSATGTWNLQPESRSQFGVNVQNLTTEFGSFDLVLDRHMDPDDILFADLSFLAPCFMAIPGKGHFFLEEISKSGAYDRRQLYGEIGLELGPAGWHGKAINLHTP